MRQGERTDLRQICRKSQAQAAEEAEKEDTLVDQSKAQSYTIERLLKNLVLAEEHCKDHEMQPLGFCLECLEKHLLLIEGLAEEAVAFFPGSDLFGQLAEWAGTLRSKLDSLMAEDMLGLSQQARAYRKDLSDLSGECQRCKDFRERQSASEGHI